MNRSLLDVEHRPFWTDRSDGPEPNAPLTASSDGDLVIVGGGFTGLWTAILAKDADPDRDVVLVEAKEIAYGGTGRNGGFIAASLTHGLAHGQALWPSEMSELVRLGHKNLDAIAKFVANEGIECDLTLVGKSAMALTSHAVEGLPAIAEMAERWGERVELLDAEQAQNDVRSPTYRGGVRFHTGSGLMDPARLAWGLLAAAQRRGVRIYENTPVNRLTKTSTGIRVHTSNATLDARSVVIATNGFTPLLRRLRWRILPVFDHVLVTEPLSAQQLSDIGWQHNQGLTDIGNQFHYYRRTPDNRILWGGYDAIYYRGNATDASLEKRDSSHELLADQFFATFPQLEGLRFTHKWAGIIDSTSRFTPVFGTAFGGALSYSVGYTGLGTGAARFGAQVALDLLAGEPTERTRLAMVQRKPIPFPPEPLRYPVVQLTRRALAREDRTGRRGIWLSTLDRLGVGFNS